MHHPGHRGRADVAERRDTSCRWIGSVPRARQRRRWRARASTRIEQPAVGVVCIGTGIELASTRRAEGTTMAPTVTLLDLVNAVAEHASSEAEVIATIVSMVNQGHV